MTIHKVYYDGRGEEGSKGFKSLINKFPKNWDLEQKHLDSGDFHIFARNHDFLIERKTMPDFLAGIKNNHNRKQLALLSALNTPSYMIIIGKIADIFHNPELRCRYNHKHFLSAYSHYIKDYAVPILRADNNNHFVHYMEKLADPVKFTVLRESRSKIRNLDTLTKMLCGLDGYNIELASKVSKYCDGNIRKLIWLLKKDKFKLKGFAEIRKRDLRKALCIKN